MKLHYSQTEYSVVPNKGTVSVPYEITLLSNGFCRNFCLRWVSVPYEITLLSNQSFYFFLSCFVSVPYEITLLSNNFFVYHRHYNVSVPYEITLLSNTLRYVKGKRWFQYLMKLHYSQTPQTRRINRVAFQYLMKLHYSQTSNKLRHYNAQGNNIRYIYYTI